MALYVLLAAVASLARRRSTFARVKFLSRLFTALNLLPSIATLDIARTALYIMPAAAADPMRFALCYDLSKAYTFVTPQVAQAARDYADLLNMKGGIEGHPVEMIVQDHGNEPQRGIECYERLKREGVMVFDMLSTPVSRAVLPRVRKDGNVLIQSLAGRGDAVDGDVFKWVFPIRPTYWGQASNDIEYIKQKSGGNLKGVKVAFLYVDYPRASDLILRKALKGRSCHQITDATARPFLHLLKFNSQTSAGIV